MKLLLVVTLALFILGSKAALGEKGTYLNQVEFIQYSDPNTAIEEVKNGNLDAYYSAVPSNRLDPQLRQDLQVVQSTGTEYSLLLNPAPSEKFNPFSIKEVRFALNYLVDRNLIVDEILNGYGSQMVSAYKPYDPDYLLILGTLQSFNFQYNPSLAEEMISDGLVKAGAQQIHGQWYFKSKPVEITIFIRNDDQVRQAIGEILASNLQKLGFVVNKNYGDLTKAFSVVYGSNPADMQWNIYTEAYTMGGFVRYDSVIISQMYSPWFSNMPGFNNPEYWNYQNASLDLISKSIFDGNFTSSQTRAGLLNAGVKEGIQESVRVFLAAQVDQYVANMKVHGIIDDFGAGITSRFTPINSREDSGTMKIGVGKIYQGAWNPIGGFTDSYSQEMSSPVMDPGDFKNPYTGFTIPVRTTWQVQTAGPSGKLTVPDDAIKWVPQEQKWMPVGPGARSTSKVTFHMKFSNWHDGKPMDMKDVLYGIYFLYQWGWDKAAETKTFDSEYSPKANQAADTLVGVKVIDNDTIEVYQNYWHFDKDEIADSAEVWPSMPWEMMYAMEKSVTGGELAFSRSDAISKNIDWLSLIVPKDAQMMRSNLGGFEKENDIPPALAGLADSAYCDSRYNASISWIESHNNAMISNGPYYFDSYLPEAREITLKAFNDPTYPLGAGYWSGFEQVKLPKIKGIEVPTVVNIGKELDIPVNVTPNSDVYYYFINSKGQIVFEGNQTSGNGSFSISVPEEKTLNFTLGGNDLKIFTVSDAAYRPDTFSTSFLAVPSGTELPQVASPPRELGVNNPNYVVFLPVVVVAAFAVLAFVKLRRNRIKSGERYGL
ncbi:MAG TPA: ABC transporter substrate-binding protein [Candidatus Nitrosotalea sp.]|nr:ABC transporter substrate-binding protein [Candidatus Nitrosotalea sp.]